VEQGEASLSPDGVLLAAQYRKKDIVVIDVSTGAQQRLKGHRGRIALVQFAADGQLLVTADLDGGVHLWPRDGQRIVDKG
jgi:WD40 repeat protein